MHTDKLKWYDEHSTRIHAVMVDNIITFKWNSKLGYFPINHHISIGNDKMSTDLKLGRFYALCVRFFFCSSTECGNWNFTREITYVQNGFRFKNCCLKSLKVNRLRLIFILHVIWVGDFWNDFKVRNRNFNGNEKFFGWYWIACQN